jgi:predicted unusual protein kinase regulating ubiquinone biosynthesis (AarF/ABC1/UbiB family)
VLGREYGRGWQRRFAHFDYEPIAAASIGQVHRARAADGRELALKIQYPGVARSIRSDVENLAAMLQLLKLLPHEVDVPAIAAEAARQLGQEADYLAEAESLDRFAQLVAGEPRLAVPRVHRDLTTARILAMDYMDGEPLDSLAEDGVPQAARDAIGALLERLMFRELFEFRVMQTDPNFANYLWQPATGRVVLLDFGSSMAFEPGFVRNYASITRAVIAGDRDEVARLAVAIGYAAPGDPAALVDATTDVILLVCEPLRHAGRYDFAASDLPSRARSLGIDLGLRQGLLRTPPPQTLFLHRKLIGSFLTLAHIRARVDARSLVLPLLQAALRDAR